MLTTKEIRTKCTPTEMERYVGFTYHPDKCIGVNPQCQVQDKKYCSCCCKQDGDHSTHVWEDERIIVDRRTRQRNGHEEEYNSPIRWYNFQYSLFLKKNNVKEAIKYCKENCFDLAGDPDYIPSKLGFPNYSKLLEYIREAEINYPFSLSKTN